MYWHHSLCFQELTASSKKDSTWENLLFFQNDKVKTLWNIQVSALMVLCSFLQMFALVEINYPPDTIKQYNHDRSHSHQPHLQTFLPPNFSPTNEDVIVPL